MTLELTRPWCGTATPSWPRTRRTFGTSTGSEPRGARPVRPGAACGADASTRAHAIRPTRMPASHRRRRIWTAPMSTSGSSRSCRPIPTTSTATATASGARSPWHGASSVGDDDPW